MKFTRKLKKIITLLIFNGIIFNIFINYSYGQVNDLTFNNINIEQGISQSTAEVIFQDSKGYIWIGTNDGLNRYNGYEYKIYSYEEDKNSISHNGITDIIEDDNGYIWVSTVQGGNKIDPKNRKIKNYTEENNKIKEDSTSELLKTKDNKIIVGTYEGLQIYNEKTDSFQLLLDKKDGLLSDTIYSIDEDDKGNIWIGTDSGVNKISKDFKILESYESEKSLDMGEVYNVYCDDKHNSVWIGTSDSGLYKIDVKTKKLKEYKNNPDDKNSLPANQIGAILRDRYDNLWIGTSGGLAYYDEENDNFKIYKNKIYDKNSLVFDNVKDLMEDKEGIIWVGTYSGISIFDKKNTIKHYKAGPDEDYLLAENMVHGVYEDDMGYLWVGSKSKGISIIDRENQKVTFLNTENNEIIPTNTINDITGYKDFIFVATDEGLIKINVKSKTIKLYTIEDNLVNNAIKDILVDNNGYLWVGTIGGLSLINIETDEIIDMTQYISTDKYIKHMYQDEEGNYYIGLLKDAGLCYINVHDKTIKYFKNEKNNKNSISSNRIRYINGDNKGNIWIGTSYGLNKFNKESETFERYTAKDGIANNTIYGILVDDDDNIWISTNKGISKINQDTNKIENLSITDGLQSNEFNGNATFKSSSGELFFGGINGLNAFYPKDIKKISKNTEVLFDSFDVDSKEYLDIDKMKFNSHTNKITIKFFSPIYSGNKNLMYEYELVGSDSGVSTTKNNYITYNRLYPGKYTFKVRVIDNVGNVSKTSYVHFTIKPPFWMSYTAIGIYILIGAFLIIKSKTKVKNLDNLVNEKTKDLQVQLEKNKILYDENLNLEKNKNNYLINLSHELRTPLNVINSTNQLMESLNNNNMLHKEKLNHYIHLSQKNCDRLLRLINNILDNSKLQNNKYEITLKEIDIVYLVEETALHLLDYAKTKGIELIIDPQIEEKQVKCDSNEIERCIVNLISNAIKFTPSGGCITVCIEDLEDKVKINVLDTGQGIDEKFHKTIFDRFSQVSEDEIIKGGSGLGLTITSQIVKLHKGKIYVESKIGEGSNFIIILPVDPQIEDK